jgi:hypothetical protein
MLVQPNASTGRRHRVPAPGAVDRVQYVRCPPVAGGHRCGLQHSRKLARASWMGDARHRPADPAPNPLQHCPRTGLDSRQPSCSRSRGGPPSDGSVRRGQALGRAGGGGPAAQTSPARARAARPARAVSIARRSKTRSCAWYGTGPGARAGEGIAGVGASRLPVLMRGSFHPPNHTFLGCAHRTDAELVVRIMSQLTGQSVKRWRFFFSSSGAMSGSVGKRLK